MRVITLLNQKGGVGKTSTCHHLAGALARLGKRVLLVDNDPQASLSQGLLGPDETFAFDASETVASIYRGDGPLVERLAYPVMPDIDLVIGSPDLARHNDANPFEADLEDLRLLAAFCDLADYDVALIDCPPNLQVCSLAALLASTALLIPVQAEDYGAQGLLPVSIFATTARGLNPRLVSCRVFLNQIDRRLSLHQMYAARLREKFAREILATEIPQASAYKEAILHRKPVTHYNWRSKAAAAMVALAHEVLSLEPSAEEVAS